jgi:hypothetical protein
MVQPIKTRSGGGRNGPMRIRRDPHTDGTTVADVHHLDADQDPEPTFHSGADAKPTFPFDADADSDPNQSLFPRFGSSKAPKLPVKASTFSL